MTSEKHSEPSQSLNLNNNSSSNIQSGGIAGRDNYVNQVQNISQTTNIHNHLHIATDSDRALQPLNKQEYRWRQTLLNKVKKYWIEGELKKSLYSKVLIKLGVEERPDVIKDPWRGLKEFPQTGNQIDVRKEDNTDIFASFTEGDSLLILGDPGVGKTVNLLRIAEALALKAEKDINQRLPVVLKLSSWKKGQAMEYWVVQELQKRYKISKLLGKAWLKEQILILLLDGLDEVDKRFQEACVKELNKFIESYSLTQIFISSRIENYLALSEKLSLENAVCIKPLTTEQVDNLLGKSGEKLASLRTVLRSDPAIREWARTPLILSVMVLTYEGRSAKELMLKGTVQEWHRHLFNNYVSHMLGRKENAYHYVNYSKKDALSWLEFLAAHLARENQSQFLIEDIQPQNWLNTFSERLQYLLVWGTIWGLILSLILLYNFNFIFNAKINLAAILALGVMSGTAWSATLNKVGALGEIAPVERLKIPRSISEVKETLQYLRRNLSSKMLGGFIIGCFWSLPCGLLLSLIFNQIWGSEESVWGLVGGVTGVVLGITAGLLWSFISGVTYGFMKDIESKSYPNQGIINSAKNGVLVLAFSFVVYLLFLVSLKDFVLDALEVFLEKQKAKEMSAFLYVNMFLFVAWISFYAGGGMALTKHFSLRVVLTLSRKTPWNYTRFLRYASERLLMVETGNSFHFVHPLLQDHLATMQIDRDEGMLTKR
jgi:hypothetical protein